MILVALGPLVTLSAQKGETDPNLDTPAKQATAAKARESVRGVAGWETFTSPHYIAMVQFDVEKQESKRAALAEAR